MVWKHLHLNSSPANWFCTEYVTGTCCADTLVNIVLAKHVGYIHTFCVPVCSLTCQILCSCYFKKAETWRARSLMRRHLFDERAMWKYRNTTAVKWYEKYFLFRWTASKMSQNTLQQNKIFHQIASCLQLLALCVGSKTSIKLLRCVQWVLKDVIKTLCFVLLYVQGTSSWQKLQYKHWMCASWLK